MIAKILKLFKRGSKWVENLFCIESADRQNDKNDQMNQHEELAKVFAELNNPPSRMEILMRQTVAERKSSERKPFSR